MLSVKASSAVIVCDKCRSSAEVDTADCNKSPCCVESKFVKIGWGIRMPKDKDPEHYCPRCNPDVSDVTRRFS